MSDWKEKWESEHEHLRRMININEKLTHSLDEMRKERDFASSEMLKFNEEAVSLQAKIDRYLEALEPLGDRADREEQKMVRCHGKPSDLKDKYERTIYVKMGDLRRIREVLKET